MKYTQHHYYLTKQHRKTTKNTQQ